MLFRSVSQSRYGGNRAEVTYVDYVDKKGKVIERYPLRFKWLEKS